MMPAHPDIAQVIKTLREAGIPPPSSGNVETVRAYLEQVNAFAARSSVPLMHERVLSYDTARRQVPCKLYWPDESTHPHLLVYCHGGGFRHGTLAGWDAPLRHLVRESSVAVLSIEYALSPEHCFPAAFDEVVSILTDVTLSRRVDGQPVRCLALGGDSAGANLALGAALALRNEGIDTLRYLLLFYGVYSRDVSSRSWKELGGYGGHGISAASMKAYWETYTPNGEDDWRVQPLHADLRHLPATRLIVGALDPLVDENIALETRLNAAGVAASLAILPGIIHGVIRFNELAPVVSALIRDEARKLRIALDHAV